MTFNFAPWAIDGARTAAALGRLATYASGGGRSGIIQPSDLKVTSLAVPGNGLRILSGGAVILNHYLTSPDEAYVASNPAVHTVLSVDMPAPQPTTAYYLVCVVIGDPEFNQTGHPFMPSGPLDPAVAPDFEYVRPRIIPCNPGVTRFEQLGVQYPGVALARLEIPANTSTVTNAMITDVRELANARESTRLLMSQPSGQPEPLDINSFRQVGNWAPWIEMPVWATWVEIVSTVTGISHLDPDVVGQVRNRVTGPDGYVVGAPVYYELEDTSTPGGERITLQTAFGGDLRGWAGRSLAVTLEASRISGAGKLEIYGGTTIVHDVRFSERPI